MEEKGLVVEVERYSELRSPQNKGETLCLQHILAFNTMEIPHLSAPQRKFMGDRFNLKKTIQ